MKLSRPFWLIAPFATWIALMMALPADIVGYAVRTVVTVLVLVAAFFMLRKPEGDSCADALTLRERFADLEYGILMGLAVFAIWVLPEQFGWSWYSRFCIYGEGGTAAVAESSPAMIAIRLAGSAFVIAVAEEMFFRKWLIGFAGFWPMVALFAIEHDRWLVGALAGIAYGFIYLRRGLFSAIVAHVTTNLVLGFWVLATGQYQFW